LHVAKESNIRFKTMKMLQENVLPLLIMTSTEKYTVHAPGMTKNYGTIDGNKL